MIEPKNSLSPQINCGDVFYSLISSVYWTVVAKENNLIKVKKSVTHSQEPQFTWRKPSDRIFKYPKRVLQKGNHSKRFEKINWNSQWLNKIVREKVHES